MESVVESPDSGQGSEPGNSAASTTSQSADAGLWDPCGLPESALSAEGMDPASKESGIADVDFTDAGWNICQWKATAGWYRLAVLAGPPSLDEVEARPDYAEYTPTTVGARRGVQFRSPGATHDLMCYLAVEIPNGTVTFRASARASVGAKEDMCTVVGQHASGLASFLPE
ncbi:DUF3558 domain-containing protein [Nocardia cyriacigeorgica]|uniref:DUF3558 domain-containing protein n=1 Tax=Nocardia cyriacigeorgica TaxID=135487 RepID=UPI003D7A5944